MTTYQPTPTLDALKALTQPAMAQVDEVMVGAAKQPVALISDITRHILKAGGKRLRPCLTVACAQLLGYSGQRHIALAAAVELIHTATLLHDDVVDESTLRRGNDTANAIWSNQSSVLVGDYLLSRAFQLMVADGSIEVLTLLSDASATISQGEVKQLMAAGDLSTDQALYLEIIHAKTAALFSAACSIGAYVSEQPEYAQPLHMVGTALGVAFQLVDDALDYSAHQETLGKTVGDDLREGKVTLPVILAYAKGSADERAFWERVIERGEHKPEDVSHAIALCEAHGSTQATLALAKDYTAKAADALVGMKGDQAVTHALLDCLAFCTERVV